MSDTFDPYHEWLGIPKQEQPASAYRLLGIREFEHDGAVIANAADRTMKHLRTYQAGKRSRISQKLLNEVANAKITLLDEKSKTQYDAELAVEFQASKKPLEETVTPPPQINIEPFVEDHTNAIESIAKGNQSSRGRRQRRGNKAATQSVQSRFLFVGFIAVLMIPIMVGIAFTVLKLSPPGPFANQQATKKARFIRQREANFEEQRKANKRTPIKTSAKDKAKRKAKAEREAKEQAERIAKIEAEQKAKAERNAKEEAERIAKIEAEQNAKRKAEEEAQRKATEEAAKRKAERTIKVFYYDNGQKKGQFHYKDGELDGLWTEWYENGQKEWEVNFKDGEQDGLWTKWHENGQKELEGNYKDGEQEGLRQQWDENGQKKLEGNFKDGEQEGLWIEWYTNGQKEREFHFKNDNLVSASVWKPDGEPCPITKIVDGSGIVLISYENGQKFKETHYKDGKKDGLETWWDEDGNKNFEIEYKDGTIISRKEF